MANEITNHEEVYSTLVMDGPSTVVKLAESMYVSQPTVRRLLNDLAAREWTRVCGRNGRSWVWEAVPGHEHESF